MAEILKIDDYLESCENCIYHIRLGVCGKPGGGHWDNKFSRCISFKRKPKGDEHGK